MTKQPQIWLLNAAWGRDDMSPLFLDRGFWEPEPSSHFNVSVFRRIRKGSEVQLVLISAALCRTTKAIGKVTGINSKHRRISITWEQTHLNFRKLHRGGVGPICGPVSTTGELPKSSAKKRTKNSRISVNATKRETI